jgi:catechol 2,3-dioxygenase-like lactoylglutathione lyase family enzyme
MTTTSDQAPRVRSDNAQKPNALQIFHVNINCSNLERSRAFYEAIGFKVVNDFSATSAGGTSRTFAEIGLAPMLNLPADCDARALLLALTDHPHATRLDLIEWITPKSASAPRGDLARLGFGRLCLKVRDCRPIYDGLVAGGWTVYSPPMLIDMGGTQQLCFCCEDPDGVVVEFMQFLRPVRQAAASATKR